MPIYEYEVIEGGCKACGGRFELRRPAGRSELTRCPLCKKAVRRVVSAPSVLKVTAPLSVARAKSAGFQVFERREKGVYERL